MEAAVCWWSLLAAMLSDFPHHLSPLLSTRVHEMFILTRTGSLCCPLAHAQSASRGMSHGMEFQAKPFCGWGQDETNTAPGVFLMDSSPWICGQRDAHISHHTLFSGLLCPPLSQAPWHLHWPFHQPQVAEREKSFLRQPFLCPLETYHLL